MDIDIVLTRLAMKHPFIATCAMRLSFVADHTVERIATDGESILYNPDWLGSKNKNEQVFCVAHEALHSLLLHMHMMHRWWETKVGPDGLPFDSNRMNRAMDYLINGALKRDGFALVSNVCVDSKYDLSYDLVRLYRELAEQGDWGSGEVMDEHRPKVSTPRMTPAEVYAAAKAHTAIAGNKSSIVQNVMMKVLPAAESPWAALRDQLVRGGSPEVSSWKRPNRRLISRGIIAPSLVSQASPPLAVVVDISGSVHAQINIFLNHVASIVQECRCQKLLLLFVDDAVRRAKEYDDIAEFVAECENMQVPQGGGTDMTKGLDYCIKGQYTRVVVLTDMYTPFGRAPDMEVIWAATTGVKPPYGTVVRI